MRGLMGTGGGCQDGVPQILREDIGRGMKLLQMEMAVKATQSKRRERERRASLRILMHWRVRAAARGELQTLVSFSLVSLFLFFSRCAMSGLLTLETGLQL